MLCVLFGVFLAVVSLRAPYTGSLGSSVRSFVGRGVGDPVSAVGVQGDVIPVADTQHTPKEESSRPPAVSRSIDTAPGRWKKVLPVQVTLATVVLKPTFMGTFQISSSA